MLTLYGQMVHFLWILTLIRCIIYKPNVSSSGHWQVPGHDAVWHRQVLAHRVPGVLRVLQLDVLDRVLARVGCGRRRPGAAGREQIVSAGTALCCTYLRTHHLRSHIAPLPVQHSQASKSSAHVDTAPFVYIMVSCNIYLYRISKTLESRPLVVITDDLLTWTLYSFVRTRSPESLAEAHA